MSPRKSPAKPPATASTKPAPKKPAVKRTAKPRSAPAPRPAAAPEVITAAPPSATPARSRGVSRSATSAVDRKNEPISEFTIANTRHDTLIAPNFLVYELTRSELADRRGIPNHFASDQELRAAIHLAREVLQPIRDAFGSFTPNSVFRGNPLERALKNKPATWVSTSQHSRGEACDIEIVGMSTLELARWAAKNLTFDQIICECYDPAKGPNSGWVHISLKAPGSGENRGQLLSYIADQGKMVYVPGLRATVA